MDNKQAKKIDLFLITLLFISIQYPRVLANDSETKRLAERYGKNFFVDKINLKSDINFSVDEFFYLTDLKEKCYTSIEKIKKANENLLLKNRFSAINLDSEKTKNGVNLSFILNSCWIFKKLIIKGIWFDQHRYSSLYKNQPGEIFNSTKHIESIENIKKTIYNSGHFNCTVNSELSYSKKDKTISTKIFISKKQRFKIKNVEFELKEKGCISRKEFSKTEKRVKNKLIKNYYSKKDIILSVKKIRTFLRNKGFKSPRISIKKLINRKKKTVSILFKINPGNLLLLKFFGNSVFTEKEIRKDIIGLAIPSLFFSPEIISQQLINQYYKKGFWNCSIRYKKDNPNCFLFEIKENNPVIVRELQFIEGDKRKKLKKIENPLENKRFDEEILEKYIEELKTKYKNKGYWDFEVIDKKVVRNKNKQHCTIQITIKKGKKRYWAGTKFKDPGKIISKNIFDKYPQKNSGQLLPFNFYWLQEQKLLLIKQLQKNGFWFSNVLPKFDNITFKKEDTKAYKTSVYWQINSGEQTKFGKVFIRGNTKLPFKRIIRELTFDQGDCWNKESLYETQRKLKKLDIFNIVRVQSYNYINNEQNRKLPVELILIDDSPIQIRFKLGYFLASKNFLINRQSTFRFGASFISKNPTNNADRLFINTNLTRFEQKFDVDYKIPSPFGIRFKKSNIAGCFKAYANRYVHPVEIQDSPPPYKATEGGFSFGLNNEFKKNYFWKIYVGNEWIETKNANVQINLLRDYKNHTIPFFFLQPSLIVEKLDNKLDVKNGNITFASLKTMIPYKSGNPISKVMFEQSIFKTVLNKITLATRLRAGYIFRTNFCQIESSQRFYLGGPHSVRGYEKDSIPPVGIKQCKNKFGKYKKFYSVQGGNGMININLEARFDLYQNLFGVVFQDIGVLTQSGLSGLKGRWFPSTGFGLRYKTPIGPIRFDIGWKWKHILPKDSSFAWYLTFGEAF